MQGARKRGNLRLDEVKQKEILSYILFRVVS